MKKTYTVVHVDAGQGVEAWFPDCTGLRVPGDRLADTIFSAPLVLQRHVARLWGDGSPVPEPTPPAVWAIHDQFRKLRMREETSDTSHEALMLLACAIVAHRYLRS